MKIADMTRLQLIAALIDRNAEVDAVRLDLAVAERERDHLARFKAYVHQRLDEAGIPTHPRRQHSNEGCRVGDRMDLLVAQRDEAVSIVHTISDRMWAMKAERDEARAENARLRDDVTREGHRALLEAQAEALEAAAGVICEWTRTCRSNNCRCRVLRDRATRLRREAEGK